jgi:hypothetical protein
MQAASSAKTHPYGDRNLQPPLPGRRESSMQDTIYIRDELVLEAHPDPDNPHILLRRKGELGDVRVYLNEVRYLADAVWAFAATIHVILRLETPSLAAGMIYWLQFADTT